MSRAEVVDLLSRREIDPIVVQAEVARLEGVGLIDDDALATTLVDRLVERKKLGPSALRAELMRRRLDPRAIEAILALQEPDDEGSLIAALVDERMRRIGALDRETAERRLLAYLARKGHGGSAARDSVRAALDDAGLERAPRSSGFGSRGSSGGFGSRGSASASAGASDGPRRVEFA
nr:RecX family transcriptional regulator [Microcella alkalica]